MPKPFVAHRSACHRTACLGLYRALLEACAQLPGRPDHTGITTTLQSLVRYRFHQDRRLLSPTQILNGLKAGHDLLRLLRECSRPSPAALTRLAETVEATVTRAEDAGSLRAKLASQWRPPPPSRHKHLDAMRRAKHPGLPDAASDGRRIGEHPGPRPRAETAVSPRKIPSFIVTHGIPLLKYPGPQPLLLNRVLKRKIAWGVATWQTHDALEAGASLAECEDEWDAMLRRDHGVGDAVDARRASDATWVGPYLAADEAIATQVYRRTRQLNELGEKLWKVRLAERALREKERRAAKHARRMERKQAREGSAGG